MSADLPDTGVVATGHTSCVCLCECVCTLDAHCHLETVAPHKIWADGADLRASGREFGRMLYCNLSLCTPTHKHKTSRVNWWLKPVWKRSDLSFWHTDLILQELDKLLKLTLLLPGKEQRENHFKVFS